ncbi:hypothetical protein C8A05DRAFT_20571 [Staphylotrichum tortipilum]|uniref:Enoyl reductase (ER) domain-containing protein n=1 Tax=Staphylotrichum tortipilum TaxID=2831512 RepID=A0AAN6M7P2_9PEZI|nr:hypothetical protein C8A05DRAFT_20571 [Staphylotrichum longicolle]
MKAIRILGPKSSPTITFTPSFPLPTAPPSTPPSLLLRVHAAGVTGDEVTWPELYANPTRIPGFEVSGTIHSLPEGYTGPRRVGEEVYALMNVHHERGGQAGFVYVRVDEVARKPRVIGFGAAAALPIPVVTAWEGLVKHAGGGLDGAGLRGKRVLVTGASGAVGSAAVQLAKKVFGAGEVVALASKGTEGYLSGLGADRVVDYRGEGWEKEVGERTVDVVFDAAGSEAYRRAWKTVKDDGVVVTVADPPPAWAFDKTIVPEEAEGRTGVRYVYFIVLPDEKALDKIADLIDDGSFQPLSVVEYPAEKAVEAWAFAQQRGRQSKVAVDFVSGPDE